MGELGEDLREVVLGEDPLGGPEEALPEVALGEVLLEDPNGAGPIFQTSLSSVNKALEEAQLEEAPGEGQLEVLEVKVEAVLLVEALAEDLLVETEEVMEAVLLEVAWL